MDRKDLEELLGRQRKFFETHQTRSIDYRLKQLKKLRALVKKNEAEIHEALRKDLGRPPMESAGGDTGLVQQELGLAIRKLRSWSRTRRVMSPIVTFNARSYYRYEPYGNVLVISPWNYPFQLLFIPMIGAMAAGNCVLAKPSRHASSTAELMTRMIGDNFDPAYISVIKGSGEVNRYLFELRFDYIFFTGGQETGKKVMRAAAEHLTPVSLELGGKNPVIIDKSIHLRNTAKRILWGKFLNAGQSCVAPDYLLVHKDVKDELLLHMKKYLNKWLGAEPGSNTDFSRIINTGEAERLQEYLGQGRIVYGGQADPGKKYVSFTILDNIPEDAPILKEEVFGPVLPVIAYSSLGEALGYVSSRPRPLSLYVFSSSRRFQKEVMNKTVSGNACINETVVQFINPRLPFGGIGTSGMGKYHGRYSFETFSNKRAYMNTSNLIDLPIRYPPYGKKARLLSFLMR